MTQERNPVVMWFNPSCSKCRGAEALLAERAVPLTVVRYLDEPPPRAEIVRVLALLGTTDPRALARTDEALWGELGLDDAGDEEVLDALATHPSLLQRPVVMTADRAVVARPPDLALSLLDGPAG